MVDSLSNFPNGVTSFGVPVLPQILAQYGVFGNVVFVCNRSNVVAGTGTYANPYSTLAAALADPDLRANSGDAVVVLPGHSESVADTAMLTSLLDGVSIIGYGRGSMTPTFRWTATTSQWVMDNANTVIAGLRLRLEGANGVVKAINITGAGFLVDNCDIEVASGASNKATIAVEVGSGATDGKISNNTFRGTETHNVTDGIKVVGGTVPSGLVIENNKMIFSATAGNGLIHVTVAAKRLLFANNAMYNTHTASTATIAFDDVASDGLVYYGGSATINDGTASAQGVVIAGSNVLVRAIQHFSSDEKAKSGVLNPAAVAS